MNATQEPVPPARLAFWLALPSALTLAVVGFAFATSRELPFWVAVVAIPACILATLDGIPAAWRSAIPISIKFLLSAVHLLGFCLAAYPLFLGVLFYIPH
jgi:hypothetical protein